MRISCRPLVTLLLFSCSMFAKAVTVRTQDPNYASITNSPSTFSFSVCPTADPYLDRGNAISANGCFGGVNQVNSSITSLTLSFPDTPVIQNSGPNLASSDIFQNATVTENNSILSFVFSGGELIEGQTFVVTEDGVQDPSQFPLVTLTYTTAAATPEPSPALLVATGLLCLGGLYLERRRRA